MKSKVAKTIVDLLLKCITLLSEEYKDAVIRERTSKNDEDDKKKSEKYKSRLG